MANRAEIPDEILRGFAQDQGFRKLSPDAQDRIVERWAQENTKFIPPPENLLQKAASVARTSMGPMAQAGGGLMNTAAFGLPGLAVDKLAPQGFKDYIKPQGMAEGIARGVGDVAGFMVGGPEQLAAKGAEKGIAELAIRNPGVRTAAMGVLKNPFLKGTLKGSAAMGSLEAPQVLAGNESPGTGALKTIGGGILQGAGEALIPPAMQMFGGIKKLPGKIKDIWNSPKTSAEIGGKIGAIDSDIAASEANMSMPSDVRRGQRITNTAHDNVMSEFEAKSKELTNRSRNIFSNNSGNVKSNFSKLKNDTYAKYEKILSDGEEEAIKNGMSAEDYRSEVIQPILDTIEKTGAKTPAAEKLRKMFSEASEDLGDAAYAKADAARLDRINNLDSVEKIKSLRTSLYKSDSGDFIQNMYSDLHQKFVGKYSPTVAEANKHYRPMAQAIKWGNKSIKPWDEHQIKNIADILQKQHGGKLDETTAAYLKTLKDGSGDFKGADITKLEKTHKSALDALDKEIADTKAMMSRLESNHAMDISNIKKGAVESQVQKGNILQDVASKKSEKAKLGELKVKIDRDLKTRDDLIRFGTIAGLSSLGVGSGVYALARALHEK